MTAWTLVSLFVAGVNAIMAMHCRRYRLHTWKRYTNFSICCVLMALGDLSGWDALTTSAALTILVLMSIYAGMWIRQQLRDAS